MHSILLVSTLSLLGAVPVVAQGITPGRPMPLAQATAQTTAPYAALTNDLCEVANFHPEPYAGIAIDVDGGILAVNPYNDTWVKYAGPSATQMALRVQTGNDPVSIGVWNPGTPAQRRVLVACTGNHALFMHAADDGRILGALLLDSEPADLEIDEENDWAFVSCSGDNTVVQVDLDTFSILERYPIPGGQRPGPLQLDTGDPGTPGDTRVYVASMITGNNSIFGDSPATTVGFVIDVEGSVFELPDHDVHRIDPFMPVADAVEPVVANAGSLIFELARHPSGELWVLSTDSNNKGGELLDSEPELKGKIVTNDLERVTGVDATTSELMEPFDTVDLDDWQPNVNGAQYDTARSVNQVRTLAFQTDGDAFVASPMSDVIAKLGPDGKRTSELHLPHRSQCFALEVYPPNQSVVLALCLGTMSIEVFNDGNPNPVRSLTIGNDSTPASVRRGRDLMSDGSISDHGRSSCFACHPGGRADFLGWSIAGLPTDIKDVMVTQSLLSIADTFPHHWRGERDLQDFRKAFVGLLGAPPSLEPTVDQMEDVNRFIRSLKAPANPIVNPRRIVDDKVSPDLVDGMAGSAVLGQELFQDPEFENFNGNTCAECHLLETGSNGNMLFEALSPAPRAQELEIAHLRQLQHKGLKTVTLPGGNVVNERGFGSAHNGSFASVAEFILVNFPELELTDKVHIFKSVEQWDQGIAPGVHWTTWFDDLSGIRTVREIEQILIAGAEQDWLDLVVFGRFDDGSGPQTVRWLYDPATNLFVNDHPQVGDKTWGQFRVATAAGLAENAFCGAPLGNGFRIAFDPDADDLRSGDELAAGTNPFGPDSDRDGWPDGYEVENGENPLVQQPSPGDDAFPALVSSHLEFATARLAKYHARFSEDVSYRVEYGLAGLSPLVFEQPDFVRADTFVLTHSAPSNPKEESLNKPVPDGATVFTATITLTDRAGKVTGPVPLPDSFTPLAVQFQGPGFFLHVENISASAAPSGPDSLTATITIEPKLHFFDPTAFPPSHIPANGQMVFCNIAVEDMATGNFVQSDTFTTNPPLPTTFFLRTILEGGVIQDLEYTAQPGPFVVSDLVQNGQTQFTFTQGGLTPGQRVKVAVQGVLEPVDHAQQIYDSGSFFNFQPLLTEEFHEIVITF